MLVVVGGAGGVLLARKYDHPSTLKPPACSPAVTPGPSSPPAGLSSSGSARAASSPVRNGNLVTVRNPGGDTATFSFDGKYLAAGGTSGSVRVWRTGTWRLAGSMTDRDCGVVASVTYNRAGTLLAAGDENGRVYVWAGGRATVLRDPSGMPIRSVAFSHDNKFLAAGDAGGTVNVWRIRGWRPAGSMTDPGSAGITCVAFNPANSLIAAADANSHIYLWGNGGLPTVLADPSGAAERSVLFTADDKALVTGDGAGYLYLWHVNHGQDWRTRLPPSHYTVFEKQHDPDTKGIEAMAFDTPTKAIAAADGNGRVYLYLYKPAGHLQYPENAPVLSVAYNPSGTDLAVAANGNIYISRLKS
jgi:WD40 repeat protein